LATGTYSPLREELRSSVFIDIIFIDISRDIRINKTPHEDSKMHRARKKINNESYPKRAIECSI